MRSIVNEYLKWWNHWDDLCDRCGLCCYERSLGSAGEVVVNYANPCKYLDEKTHLCSVYENRFRTYPCCGKVNLLKALFHPTLPPSCAYVKTFRVWRGG